MVTVRTGDTEVARDRTSAANLDPRRQQMLRSHGSTSIMTAVTRPPHEDDAAQVLQAGRPRRVGDELGLPVSVPLLVVSYRCDEWWIRDRSGRRIHGVERLGRYTGPRAPGEEGVR